MLARQGNKLLRREGKLVSSCTLPGAFYVAPRCPCSPGPDGCVAISDGFPLPAVFRFMGACYQLPAVPDQVGVCTNPIPISQVTFELSCDDCCVYDPIICPGEIGTPEPICVRHGDLPGPLPVFFRHNGRCYYIPAGAPTVDCFGLNVLPSPTFLSCDDCLGLTGECQDCDATCLSVSNFTFPSATVQFQGATCIFGNISSPFPADTCPDVTGIPGSPAEELCNDGTSEWLWDEGRLTCITSQFWNAIVIGRVFPPGADFSLQFRKTGRCANGVYTFDEGSSSFGPYTITGIGSVIVS